MTTYKTDFSDVETGQSPPGWTPRWAMTTPPVVSDLLPGELYATGKSLSTWERPNAANAYSIDAMDESTDVDIMIYHETYDYASTDQINVVLRGSGSIGSHNGYVLKRELSGGLVLYRIKNGVTSSNLTATGGAVMQQRYWLRVKTEGNVIKWKAWDSKLVEPTEWYREYTDTSGDAITTPGWFGIGPAFTNSINRHCTLYYVTCANAGEHIFVPLEYKGDIYFGTRSVGRNGNSTLSTAGVYIAGGLMTYPNRKLVGVRCYFSNIGVGAAARLAVYAGGSLDNPVGASLIFDAGIANPSDAGFFILPCDPMMAIPVNQALWFAVKFATGLRITYDTLSATGYYGNYQLARGYFSSTGISSDPAVAYPSSIPAGGSFVARTISSHIIFYEKEAPPPTRRVVKAGFLPAPDDDGYPLDPAALRRIGVGYHIEGEEEL